MGFSRQEYWSGLPFPSPGDLPNPGIEPRSSALTGELTTNWKILQEMRIPDHLTCLLTNLYACQEATVRTGHGTCIFFELQYYPDICPREGNGNPLQYSCLENPMDGGAWLASVHGVAKSRTRLSNFTFTFHFHALEKEMATHSSVLAWRIPGTGEPGGPLSMGSHRVRHD